MMGPIARINIHRPAGEPLRDFIASVSYNIEGAFSMRGTLSPMFHAISRTGEGLIFVVDLTDKDEMCAVARSSARRAAIRALAR